jgi:hypothetical protein
VVAHQLVREQHLNPSIEIIFGGLGESPNGLITKDGLQYSLGEYGGAAGHADLGPNQTAGVGKNDDHQRHTDSVDA